MQNFKFTTEQIDNIMESKPINFPGSFQRESSSGKQLRFYLKGSSYAPLKKSKRHPSSNRRTLISQYEVFHADGSRAGYLSLTKILNRDKVVQSGFCIMNQNSQVLIKNTVSGALVSSYTVADATAIQMSAEILAAI